MNNKRRKAIRDAAKDLKGIFSEIEAVFEKLEECRERIDEIFDEEQESFDNIPDSLSETANAIYSGFKLEELAEVLQNLETIHDTIEELEFNEIIEGLQNVAKHEKEVG